MAKYPNLGTTLEFNEEGTSLRKILDFSEEDVECLSAKMATVTEKVVEGKLETMTHVFKHLLPILTEKEFAYFALSAIKSDTAKFVRVKKNGPNLEDLLGAMSVKALG